MATSSICLFANGDCKANEFIEDNKFSLNNDGTIHYIKFIENNESIQFSPDALYVDELLERIIMHLTDENDVSLVDEFGNCLTILI